MLIAAPLGLEAMIVKAGAPHARVRHTGMGPRRSAAVAESLAAESAGALAVMGFCGALAPDIAPGDVVVASEVRGPQGTISCFAAEELASALSRRGLRVHVGPMVSVARLVRGAQRRGLAQDGAIAVDMESAWLAAGAGERMFTVVRTVVDTPTRELSRPLSTIAGAGRAAASLRTAAAIVEEWTRRIRPRRVLSSSASDDVLDFDWLAPARTVGGTAGAGAGVPPVARELGTLDALGSVCGQERAITQETVGFTPTAGLRKRG